MDNYGKVEFVIQSPGSVGFDLGNARSTVGTGNYEKLKNKPSINGVELVGNKSFEDLGEETITNAELQEIIEQQYSMIFGGT